MSGLSYSAIQIQSWIFKTQSKSKHETGSKKFKKLKIQVQIESKNLTNYTSAF